MARRVLVELRREAGGRLVARYSDGTEIEREPAGPPALGVKWTSWRNGAHGGHRSGIYVHGQTWGF